MEIEEMLDMNKDDESVAQEETGTEEESHEQQSEEVTEDPSSEGETTEPVVDNSTQDNIPFHKHPRWLREREEKRALQQKVEELEKLVKQPVQAKSEISEKAVPAHLQPVFGDNYEAYLAFIQETDRIAEKKLEASLRAQREEQEKAQRRDQEFKAWAEEQFEELSEQSGIDMSDPKNDVRNKILDICEQYGVIDAKGYPNFSKAYELYQALYPVKDDEKIERRQIAGKASSKRSQGGEPESIAITSSVLKSRSLRDFGIN